MARIPLGGLTTLNLSTHLDPMFVELYAAAGGDFSTVSNITLGNGSGQRAVIVNGGTGASDGGVLIFQRGGVNSFFIGDHARLFGTGAGDSVISVPGAFNQRFYTNGTERMRIDGSGNLTVGSFGATVGAGTQGRLFVAGAPLVLQQAGPSQAQINFGTTSPVWTLQGGNDYIGYVFTAAGAVVQTVSSASVRPGADNAASSGTASLRWSVVYAGTGAINTSDAREKTKVAALTESELACASALAKEIGVFQFLASRDEKGADEARLHIGSTVQRVMEVMTEHGLEPTRYAFICYDEWEAEDHPAEYREETVETGFIDSAGNPITETTKIETKPAYTTPAGNRYGFRMDQLALFIARGQEERLRRIEEKLSAA